MALKVIMEIAVEIDGKNGIFVLIVMCRCKTRHVYRAFEKNEDKVESTLLVETNLFIFLQYIVRVSYNVVFYLI